MHPADDRLLDHALFEDDLEVRDHLAACAQCRKRLEECLAEHETIRTALSLSEVPAELRTRVRSRRPLWILPFAAAFLAAFVGGFLAYRHWQRLRTENAKLQARVRELETRSTTVLAPSRSVQFAAMRESVGEIGRQFGRSRQEKLAMGAKDAYLRLQELQEAFTIQYLVVDLTLELDLSAAQFDPVRKAVEAMMKELASPEADSEKVLETYERDLKAILAPEQWTDYTRRHAEELREEEIEMIVLDLAVELELDEEDLERVEELLEARLPERAGRARLWLDIAPCGALIDDAGLAAEVRGRLPEAVRPGFDRYLEANGKARETARAARQ